MGGLRDLFSRRFGQARSASRRAAAGRQADRTDLELSTDEDLVLAQLRALGADLTKPRDVRHYLYFPSEHRARIAARELHEIGYEAQVEPTPDAGPHAPQRWCVLASAKRVANEVTVPLETNRVSAVALRLAGEYDGWEAAL